MEDQQHLSDTAISWISMVDVKILQSTTVMGMCCSFAECLSVGSQFCIEIRWLRCIGDERDVIIPGNLGNMGNKTQDCKRWSTLNLA